MWGVEPSLEFRASKMSTEQTPGTTSPLLPVAYAPQMSDGFIMANTADRMSCNVLICDTQSSVQSGRCPTRTAFTSTTLTILVKPP